MRYLSAWYDDTSHVNVETCDTCSAPLLPHDGRDSMTCRACKSAITRARKSVERKESARPCRAYDDVPLEKMTR